MAFDIKLNNLSEKAEAGYEFEVKLPDGTSTDFFITVRGNQSPKMKKYSKDLFNKMQMEELRNKRKGKICHSPGACLFRQDAGLPDGLRGQ